MVSRLFFRQCLHAEEKTIEKPFRSRRAGHALGIETVKERKEKIQSDVNNCDKRGELRPAQAKQPAVDVAPSPRVGPDFDELDLAGPERGFAARVSHLRNGYI